MASPASVRSPAQAWSHGCNTSRLLQLSNANGDVPTSPSHRRFDTCRAGPGVRLSGSRRAPEAVRLAAALRKTEFGPPAGSGASRVPRVAWSSRVAGGRGRRCSLPGSAAAGRGPGGLGLSCESESPGRAGNAPGSARLHPFLPGRELSRIGPFLPAPPLPPGSALARLRLFLRALPPRDSALLRAPRGGLEDSRPSSSGCALLLLPRVLPGPPPDLGHLVSAGVCTLSRGSRSGSWWDELHNNWGSPKARRPAPHRQEGDGDVPRRNHICTRDRRVPRLVGMALNWTQKTISREAS